MSNFMQRVQAQARPGESWDDAIARLRDPLGKSLIDEVELADIFIPIDVAAKDNRHFMDVALFRISKRDKRAGGTIRHELADGYVEVKAGPDGMATIWDYDVVLMLISHLTESMNLYKKGRGTMPGRLFTPHVSDILKFCRRGDGGTQSSRVESMLDRLKGTTIKSVLHRPLQNSTKMMREVKSESLINGYRVLSRTASGKVDRVEIEIPSWIYMTVIDSHGSAVLTVSQEYFLIKSPTARFIYRLARRAAGNDTARWSFKRIYERSALTNFKAFCSNLQDIVTADNLPDYRLYEEAGVSGRLLVMVRREAKPACG